MSDSIDLLAVDEDGTTVVIELKRAKHKFQLMQAVAYAAMVANLKMEDVAGVCETEEFWRDLGEKAKFNFNQDQRVILIAEEYDYEVLATAEWLGKHDIEVKCVRVALSQDEDTKREYLAFSVVFPPTALEDEAKLRRAKTSSVVPAAAESWDAVIATIKNEAVKAFVRQCLARNQENRLAYMTFHFRLGGSRRLAVGIRPEAALVEQRGRFKGDFNEFWPSRLDQDSDLREVFGGSRLRFRLHSSHDFAAFTEAIEGPLKAVVWEPVAEIAAIEDSSPIL